MGHDADRARPVTVHGPGGRVDLVCPASTTVAALARAYAGVVRLPSLPLLYTRTGEPLPVAATLGGLGVEAGAVLVATTGVVRHPRDGGGDRRGRSRPDVVSTRDGTGPRSAVRRGHVGG